MAVIKQTVEAHMENGGTYEVEVDQRDYAAWEMQDFYRPDRHLMCARYVVFNALKRTKQIKSSWSVFNAECVRVRDTHTEAGDEVDPTNPDPSDED